MYLLTKYFLRKVFRSTAADWELRASMISILSYNMLARNVFVRMDGNSALATDARQSPTQHNTFVPNSVVSLGDRVKWV
jgi:hypothetical protein